MSLKNFKKKIDAILQSYNLTKDDVDYCGINFEGNLVLKIKKTDKRIIIKKGDLNGEECRFKKDKSHAY